jgi:predicted Zn-dependent protease
LEKAVRLNEKFLPARASLGEAYLESGKPEQAIPELKAAAAYDDTGSRIYQLSRAYQAAGKRDEATDALRDYRQISSRHAAELQANGSLITPP